MELVGIVIGLRVGGMCDDSVRCKEHMVTFACSNFIQYIYIISILSLSHERLISWIC